MPAQTSGTNIYLNIDAKAKSVKENESPAAMPHRPSMKIRAVTRVNDPSMGSRSFQIENKRSTSEKAT